MDINKPQLRSHFSWEVVDSADAEDWGLEWRGLQPDEVAGAILRQELWVESRLSAEWQVACRLLLQDRQGIFAEVRGFPFEPMIGRPPGRRGGPYEPGVSRPPGQWSGAWLGQRATVPTGGLTTRVLRRIRLGYDVRSVAQVVEHLKKKYPAELHPEHGMFGALRLARNLK